MGSAPSERLSHTAHGRILIVEDDESLRRVTHVQLQRSGYDTVAVSDVLEALEVMNRLPFDLVITDLNLPGPTGLDLLKKARAAFPEIMVVLVTAYGTVETAVEAMKTGAYDYLTKPVHPYELRMLISRALERRQLIEEVRTLRSTIDQKFGFENLVGHSPALMRVLDAASRVAQTDATVLIHGETGTGKELLAKAIHFNSPRRERPFVVINCGSIPRDLLESELFGHVRGAFTGALTHKKGKVEMAEGGTVFLDEIGEMPLDLQVRVLRLIQEREIEKVGAPTAIHVDVRIIAATHRDLAALVEHGTFREDLYYRLAVVPVELPPLRARVEDISEFVVEFFRLSKEKHHRPNLRLPGFLIPYFSRFHWPGNVRQLQNAIERMVVLCPGDKITVSDLPDFLQVDVSHGPPLEVARVAEGLTLDTVEKELVIQALKKFNWNYSRAARHLGVTRKALMGRVAKHSIQRQTAGDEEVRPPEDS
ncbi:MAG TPA: sigma-54 dependent transcriptional regulator [Bryobacteraceae bacterium]|nr:sigma-54 dependent transcriptional regulator [Bryobacteraceae bacterium]